MLAAVPSPDVLGVVALLPTDPPVREPDCPVTLWEVQKSKTGLPSCAIFGLLRVHSSIHTCIEPLQYAASLLG